MKCNKRPSYVASVFFAGLLLPSLGTLHAGEYPNSGPSRPLRRPNSNA